MKIEPGVFYRVKDAGEDKVVLALRDVVSQELVFIDQMSCGPEESFAPAQCKVLLRLGSTEEFWKDEFARAVLGVLVKEKCDLDALESVVVVDAMQRFKVPADQIQGILALMGGLIVRRKEVVDSRAKVWHILSASEPTPGAAP